MYLYFYRKERGDRRSFGLSPWSTGVNFGDELNLLIWPRVLPGLMPEWLSSIARDDWPDLSRAELFLGTGTLINARVPREPRKIVLGAGYGYAAPFVPDESWRFLCVRGPLTARILGLPERKSVLDSAYFLAHPAFRDITGATARSGPAVFMPQHGNPLLDLLLATRFEQLEVLDPRAAADTLVRRIASAPLVLAEAMHAAIVADCLRVPWIPIIAGGPVLELKWHDWATSLDMIYDPVILLPQLQSMKLRDRLQLQALVATRRIPGHLRAGLELAAQRSGSLSRDRILERKLAILFETGNALLRERQAA